MSRGFFADADDFADGADMFGFSASVLQIGNHALALFISACAVTGLADDGFERSHESLDIGKIQANELLDRVLKDATGSAKSGGKTAGQ